jgi:hypothetical protein
MEWIKNNIMQSQLPQLLGFEEEDINWLKCHEYACNSLVKVACDLWNDKFNIKDIAKDIKVHTSTIHKYLKQGTKLGWCDYDPKEEHKKAGILLGEKRRRQIICLTTGEIFNSIIEASNQYNIKKCGISTCCNKNGIQKSAGKHPITNEKMVWMYYEDYLETKI